MPSEPTTPYSFCWPAHAVVLVFALVASACASTVVPSDGNSPDVISGSDVLQGVDVLHGTDVHQTSDGPTFRDASMGIDARPMGCEIAGTYHTNGGLIMTLVLAADGTYSADGGRFVGTYSWNGSVLAFTPGPGSASAGCPSRWGSSVNVTFDPACRQALVVTATDNCTGGGLLTTSSNLTRQ